MTNAYRDENSVPTLICASKNDGVTIVRIEADPLTNRILVSDSSAGSDNGNNKGNAMKDENSVPVLIGVSSQTITVNGVNYIQGVTPVEVYGNPITGELLIDSH